MRHRLFFKFWAFSTGEMPIRILRKILQITVQFPEPPDFNQFEFHELSDCIPSNDKNIRIPSSRCGARESMRSRDDSLTRDDGLRTAICPSEYTTNHRRTTLRAGTCMHRLSPHGPLPTGLAPDRIGSRCFGSVPFPAAALVFRANHDGWMDGWNDGWIPFGSVTDRFFLFSLFSPAGGGGADGNDDLPAGVSRFDPFVGGGEVRQRDR